MLPFNETVNIYDFFKGFLDLFDENGKLKEPPKARGCDTYSEKLNYLLIFYNLIEFFT